MPRVLVIIMIAILSLTLIFQTVRTLYQNGVLTSRPPTRVLVNLMEEGPKEGLLRVRVKLSRPMKVHTGQYIYLWMPTITFWSWTQSHPFIITSWSRKEQPTLELFVQPRHGFSRSLARHCLPSYNGYLSFLGFVSGPYGLREPVERYDRILLVASDVGIAAVLPYLRMLVYSSKTYSARARRLHFVWQVETLGKYAMTRRPVILLMLHRMGEGYETYPE